MKKEEIYLSFRFSGENEIGLEEFSRFLNSSSKYINALKEDLGKNIKLNTNVIAIEKGSFIVNLVPEIVGGLIPLFFEPTITNTKDFIKLVIEILNLKEFLMGKEAKSIENNTVTNYNGETMIVQNSTINIYTNSDNKTNKAMKNFVSNIPKNRTLSISNNFSNDKIHIDDTNKKYFNDEEIDDENEEFLTFAQNVKVKIIKVALDMKSPWSIYYDKNISATITDSEFSEIVTKGFISFNSNSTLLVDMEIKSYPNNPNKKTIYTITKVHLNETYKNLGQQKLDI